MSAIDVRGLLLGLVLLVGCGAPGYVRETTVTEGTARKTTMPVGDLGDEDFRGELPGRGKSIQRTSEKPQETRLPNGVRLVTWVRHDFPSVSCAFGLDRGAAAAPPGVANLYSLALQGSSRKYDDDDAWEYLRYFGATVRTSATQDAVVLTVTALTPLFPSALSRAAPMFLEPKLNGKAVDRARTWARAERSSSADDAELRAREKLYAALFPPPHPYGVPIDGGDDRRIAGVEREALESLRDATLTAEHVVVACAGDIDPKRMAQQIDRYTSVLPSKASGATAPPTIARPAPGITLVGRPGAAQSEIALGYPGPKAGDPDRVALAVLDALSTAGISSRLNLSVRGELGATYGVRMRTVAHRDGGAIVIHAAIDTPETVPALRRLLEEIGKLRTAPAAPVELERAKLRAGFAADVDSTGTASQIAGSLLARVLAGRPASKDADAARLDPLDGEDVRAAAETWLDPKAARLVIVGDLPRIEKDLASLGLGTAERR